MTYKTIDYDVWDFEGIGKNIFPLFNKEEKELWDDSLKYQDKRNDKGHAELVTYFSFKLLENIGGERKIITPSAILHDIGWNEISEEELKELYHKNWEVHEKPLKIMHQIKGAELAKKLLKSHNYQEKYISNICEIISQHDTRIGFYSLEDGIVRSADRLWRYTIPCIKLAKKERKWSLDEQIEILNKWTNQKDFFYNDEIKEFAELELENSINYKKRVLNRD